MKQNIIVKNTICVMLGFTLFFSIADTAEIVRAKDIANTIKKTKVLKDKEMLKEVLSKNIPNSTKAVEEMLSMVDDSDEFVSEGAKKALMNLKGTSFVPVFRKKIKKGNFNERIVAMRKIGEYKDKESVSDLIDIVNSYKLSNIRYTAGETKDNMISMAAAQTLGDIGDEQAIPVLLKQVGKMHQQEAQALAKFGHKALPQLITLYKSTNNPDIKNDVGVAISNIRDKESTIILWELLKDNGDSTFINELLKLADKNTNPTDKEVIDYLDKNKENNPVFRSKLIENARKSKDIKYLIKEASDTKLRMPDRESAIIYLGDLRAKESVPALMEVINGNDKYLGIVAAETLEKITGQKYEWRN